MPSETSGSSRNTWRYNPGYRTLSSHAMRTLNPNRYEFTIELINFNVSREFNSEFGLRQFDSGLWEETWQRRLGATGI
jgi:hypothetical protein